MRKHIHPLWTVGLLTLLIALTFGKSSVRVHHYFFDGKMFYVGARVLAQGGNPYDVKSLQVASMNVAPEGWPAAAKNLPQIHLPGTLLLFIPLALLPWTAFCWLLALLNSVCITLIAYLSLRNHLPPDEQPAHWKIIVASALMLAFPPTWQNFILGQLGLYLMLASLLLVRSVQRQNHLATVALCLVALLKFTNTLPLLICLFATGKRSTRIAITIGAACYAALNFIAVFAIGWPTFLESYRASMLSSFNAGQVNSVAKGRRIDLENLMNLGVAPALILILKGLLVLGLLWFFWQSRRTRSNNYELMPTQFAALNCAALLVFYHNVYDAVLLIPVLFVSAEFYKQKETCKASTVLLALLAGCTFLIGYFKVWNKILPPLSFAPPLALSTIFVLAIFGTLVWLFQRTNQLKTAMPISASS